MKRNIVYGLLLGLVFGASAWLLHQRRPASSAVPTPASTPPETVPHDTTAALPIPRGNAALTPANSTPRSAAVSPCRPLHELANALKFGSSNARNHLIIHSIMTAASDALMNEPRLTRQELTDKVIQDTGLPEVQVSHIVKNYPRSRLNLEEQNREALENPELGAIADVFKGEGVAVDLSTDCLTDAFRMMSGISFTHDWAAHNLEDLEDLSDMPAGSLAPVDARRNEIRQEESQSVWAFQQAFRDRFIHRHHLDPGKVALLMQKLAPLKLVSVSREQLFAPWP